MAALGTGADDTDGDLMADSWEDANGLNSQDPSDGAEDPDDDVSQLGPVDPHGM